MQKNPIVNNGLEIVFNYLKEKISDLESQGIDRNRIIIDPGIGFGKSLEQNILILSKIRKFHDLNVPILLGVSRKSLIAGLSEGETADERLPGSLAAALWGLSQGVQIFRVHDVAATAQAFRIHQAIAGASE